MKLKKIARALLFPHTAVTIVLIPISAVFLIYSMIFTGTESVSSIISYVLAFYTLTVLCIKTPMLIRFFKSFKEKNELARRWHSDAHLRVNVSLYGSLIWNTAYAMLQLGLGFRHHTFWYYSLAAYYIALAVMRFFLLSHTRKYTAGEKMHDELIKYRICGIVFLVMNLALSIIVFFMIYWNRTFIHHEITTIAMAAYTFTSFTAAIISFIKYRRYNSPVYSATKATSLASACVSMLTLEATMLTTFGTETTDLFTRRLFLGISGAAISVFIITMAIYMIVQSTKRCRYKNQRSINTMDNNESNSFSFTYSAKEQKEIQRIRSKYIPHEEDKMQRLRSLDKSVYDKASALSLIIGILGTLIMGTGMCCCMVWSGIWFIPGIIIGVIGIAVLCLAYPIYNRTIKIEREKIAPEIIRLTDELMK